MALSGGDRVRLPKVDPAPPPPPPPPPSDATTDRERRVPPSERTAVPVSGAERAASGHQPGRRRPEPLHAPGQRRDLSSSVRQPHPPTRRARAASDVAASRTSGTSRTDPRGRSSSMTRTRWESTRISSPTSVGPRIERRRRAADRARSARIVEIVGRDEVGGLAFSGAGASRRVRRVAARGASPWRARARTAARRSGGELVVERPVVIARTTARRSEEPIGRLAEREGASRQVTAEGGATWVLGVEASAPAAGRTPRGPSAQRRADRGRAPVVTAVSSSNTPGRSNISARSWGAPASGAARRRARSLRRVPERRRGAGAVATTSVVAHPGRRAG